jgi:HSP20 family protein
LFCGRTIHILIIEYKSFTFRSVMSMAEEKRAGNTGENAMFSIFDLGLFNPSLPLPPERSDFARQIEKLMAKRQDRLARFGWTRDELHRFPPELESAPGGPGGVDVREENGKLTVEMDVPGIDPAEIDVDVHPESLVIRWNKKDEGEDGGAGKKENKQEQWIVRERHSLSFIREIALPYRVDVDNARAKCSRGVLRVFLTAAENSDVRRLLVESGD